MKILFALIFSATCATLRASDVQPAPLFVTVGTDAFMAKQVTFAGNRTVNAPLVYGGIGNTPAADWSGKVVLVDRGVITFAEKVRKVKDAGGVGVVIANNESGAANYSTIYPDVSNLTAVTVSQADGVKLKDRAGLPARIGVAQPAFELPDPTGQGGKWLTTDGEKYLLAKIPNADPVVAIRGVADLGTSTSFSASASGTPPFTYQWLKDGVNIPGATNAVLSISSIKDTDAGAYICLVSNSLGAVPSGAYVLTVNPTAAAASVRLEAQKSKINTPSK